MSLIFKVQLDDIFKFVSFGTWILGAEFHLGPRIQPPIRVTNNNLHFLHFITQEVSTFRVMKHEKRSLSMFQTPENVHFPCYKTRKGVTLCVSCDLDCKKWRLFLKHL